MIHELPPGKKRIITRYRAGVSVLLALAAAIAYVSLTSAADPKPTDTKDPHVVLVQPPAQGRALRQGRVFAQLAPGYTGILIVDTHEIPEDQLDHREGLSTVGFTPGKGTETGALKPGERCATVVFWPAASTRAASAASYNWCWQAY